MGLPGSLVDLAGRRALVSGGSRGIGRACVALLAAAGAEVHFCARRPEGVAAAESELRAAGLRVTGTACDVGDRTALAAWVAGAVADGLDIAVGNAGANPAFGPLADLTDAALDRTLTVNLRANLWLAQAALPHMADRDASLVIVSSISALRGEAGLGAYGLAKAADLQLVRTLAAEWGHRGVRVNAVLPGLVRTGFSRLLWQDDAAAETVRRRTALGRLVTVDEVAAVVLGLCGPLGRCLTGQAIVCDNGETAVLGG